MLYQEISGRETLYNALSQDTRNKLESDYSNFQKKTAPSYIPELGALFKETSPFTLAWVFFSFLVCLLLLLQIDGAAHAAWLLPAITLAYIFSLYQAKPPSYESLFPSENYVLEHYSAPEDQVLKRNKDILIKAWHRYLIAEWAHEVPQSDSALFEIQLEKGLFGFNTERLLRLFKGRGEHDLFIGFTWTPSILLLAAYLGWNVFFCMENAPMVESCLKWRSSVRPDLMRSVLFKGSMLGGAGALLIVVSGTFLPIPYLKAWGLPILIVALLLITIGLLPYRKLTKLETEPDELQFDGNAFYYFQNSRPKLKIPLSAIESITYVEAMPIYGLCMKLKRPTIEKMTIIDPSFDRDKLMSQAHVHFPEHDLFFPYFSSRTCTECHDLLTHE